MAKGTLPHVIKVTKKATEKMGKYYAVQNGRSTGVFKNWNDCKSSTHGYSGAVYKSFNSQAEAAAFANSSGGYSGGGVSRSSGSSGYRGGGGGTSSGGASRSSSSTSSRSYGGYSAGYASRSSSNSSSKSGNHEVVYTDGSSRGNGRTGAAGGIGVYYGDNDSRNVAEPLRGERQTNQRAELTAANRAIDNALKDAKSGKSVRGVNIHTDSEYTTKCLTSWGDKWEKNNYTRPGGEEISNLDLIREGRNKMAEYNEIYRTHNPDSGSGVKFTHVRGHTGVKGNEAADRLANKGAGF